MKVLIFTSQIYLLGGAERLAIELAEDLNSHEGIQADVISMVSRIFSDTEVTTQRLLNNGVPSVRFLDRPPRSGLWNFLQSVWRLRKILIEEDYDVVETSLPSPTTIATWAVVGLRTRHIAGIHDLYSTSLYNDYASKLWRWSCKMSKNTFYYAISQEAARSWINFASVKPEKVRLIHNAIHSSYFQTKSDRQGVIEEFKLDPHSRLLLFVGRLTLRKGLDTLIQAMKPLLEAGGVSLLIVGFPNETVETKFGETVGFIDLLKQELISCPGSNRVYWLGKRTDVPRLMASSDILIHPARHEGFGLVLAEALAIGLVVISTTVGGIPEVLENTDSVLIPPNQPEALRAAISKVLAWTPMQIATARQRGKERAEYFKSTRRTHELFSYFIDAIKTKIR